MKINAKFMKAEEEKEGAESNSTSEANETANSTDNSTTNETDGANSTSNETKNASETEEHSVAYYYPYHRAVKQPPKKKSDDDEEPPYSPRATKGETSQMARSDDAPYNLKPSKKNTKEAIKEKYGFGEKKYWVV